MVPLHRIVINSGIRNAERNQPPSSVFGKGLVELRIVMQSELFLCHPYDIVMWGLRVHFGTQEADRGVWRTFWVSRQPRM